MEFQPINNGTSVKKPVKVVKPPAPEPSMKKILPNNAVDMTKTLLMGSYATSLQSINVGFSLASALAWNEVVKEYALKNLSVKKSQYYHLIYASLVTFLSALVFMVTKMFLDSNIKRADITPMVGFR